MRIVRSVTGEAQESSPMFMARVKEKADQVGWVRVVFLFLFFKCQSAIFWARMLYWLLFLSL